MDYTEHLRIRCSPSQTPDIPRTEPSPKPVIHISLCEDPEEISVPSSSAHRKETENESLNV